MGLNTYTVECSDPYKLDYFRIHLEHMAKVGYTVTPEKLVQRQIETTKMIFSEEKYEKNYREEQINRYSAGWITILKKEDLLNQLAETHNLTLEMLNNMEPNVILQGVINTYERREIEKNGMDQYFWNQAQLQKKNCTDLESELERINLVCKPIIDDAILGHQSF